jgi:hypothetical protein
MGKEVPLLFWYYVVELQGRFVTLSVKAQWKNLSNVELNTPRSTSSWISVCDHHLIPAPQGHRANMDDGC